MENIRETMLNVINLKKNYGKFEAVKGVTFDVKKGEFFAFLGPNGAGKSTTINTICTIIDPTSGEIEIGNQKLSESKLNIRKKIGLVFQENVSDASLTIYENLKIHCDLYDVNKNEVKDRIDRALEIVQLTNEKNKKAGALSGGMKRRVEVAKAILHEPDMLFLDEPTAGLDPQTRVNMWDFLMKLKERTGMTIFLTTHHMDEAEQCDRVAILDHGKIIANDSPTALAEKYGHSKVILKTGNFESLQNFASTKGEVKRVGNEIEIHVKESISDFIKDMVNANIEFYDIKIHRPKLTDVFLNLTGREMRE